MNESSPQKSPLGHLKVIDLTHYVSGPYCTKFLAGFGAEIIKIERPGSGDPLRKKAPFYQQNVGTELSIPFLWLNTGKKSITLDLKTTEGASIVKKLVETADIVVENFSPHVLPSLGLTYEVLSTINPRLIMASISNFGQTGPYRDFLADEIVTSALSGQMDNTGSSDHSPLVSGPALNQYTAGIHAYVAILMALFKRGDNGLGQYIDISIMESAVEQIENRVNTYLRTGKITKRGTHAFAPWGIYPCKDGYSTIIGAPFRHWRKGAEIFNEHRLTDPRYLHARDRVKHRHEIDSLITPWISSNNKETIFYKGQEHGLSFGYIANLNEVLESPQHRNRGFFTEIKHPESGTHAYPDAPFKMPKSPWKSERSPLLGEHNLEIYCDLLCYTKKQVLDWSREGII